MPPNVAVLILRTTSLFHRIDLLLSNEALQSSPFAPKKMDNTQPSQKNQQPNIRQAQHPSHKLNTGKTCFSTF